MRISWLIAGALFVLTWLFASMELGFLALASFVVLVVVAMAGHYKPEALAVAGSPENKHSHAAAPDPHDLDGGTPNTAQSEKPHSHFSESHSDKKHFHEHSHSEKQHAHSQNHHHESSSHNQANSDKKHSEHHSEKKHSEKHHSGEDY